MVGGLEAGWISSLVVCLINGLTKFSKSEIKSKMENLGYERYLIRRKKS